MMKANYGFIVMLELFCFVPGCNSDGECVPGETYVVVQNTQPLTELKFIDEEPGKLALNVLSESLKNKRQFRIGVYQIERHSSQKLLDSRRLRTTLVTEKSIFAEDEEWEYQIDKNTSFESAGSKQDMHSMPGVTLDKVLEDAEYLKRAWRYLEPYRNELFERKHLSLQPYKIRKYYVSGSDMKDKISQVAVSITSSVDGWPVLGPAKTAVHFSPSGEVIGYTKEHRYVQKSVFEVTQNDILSPDEATKKVMHDNDISTRPYRTEFGYFDGGRHSAKELLAPYYMFVFHSEEGSKDLVRWISAIKNEKYLEMILKDEERDIKRKQGLIENEKGDVKYE